jgi:hypothetical protein
MQWSYQAAPGAPFKMQSSWMLEMFALTLSQILWSAAFVQAPELSASAAYATKLARRPVIQLGMSMGRNRNMSEFRPDLNPLE